MEPRTWARVKSAFETLMPLSVSERQAALADLRASDPDLLEPVLAMLAADEETEGFLAEPAAEARLLPAYFAKEVAGDPWIGKALGAYRLTGILGVGGMSTVYAAERSDGLYEQVVAVKVMRVGGPGAQARERFAQERTLLARLEHPAITRLLDGGFSEHGWPYVVMEKVDGLPVDVYCQRHALSLDQRLDLLIAICDAVEYAHQNLIVHRDLKPSNVLVVTDDQGQPRPKLLDFGIAKLLDDSQAGAVQTQTGWQLLTPQYAAPEQIRGGAITTATDVYALGVLAYEVLAGRRPYDVADQPPTAVERVVCEQDVARPSTVAERDAARLRGDLDVILLKALQKDPSRRYRTAAALADDLRRHRRGLPVLARPDTVTYRLSKFGKRHGRALTLAGLAVLALIAVTTYYTLRLAGERDRAQAEADKATQVNAFLRQMLGAADPYQEGRDVRVVDVLGQASAQLDTALAEQPLVAASLRHTVGMTYLTLGAYDAAEPHLQTALALRRDLAARDAELLESVSALGQYFRVTGDYEAAAPLAEEELALARRAYGDEHARVATALNNRAVLLQGLGDHAAALPLYQEVLRIDRARYGDLHPEVAVDLNNLATCYADLGRYEEAVQAYREALAIQEAQPDPVPISIANTLTNLAITLNDVGEDEAVLLEADSLFRRALALRRAELGEDHPDYAHTLYSHTLVLPRLGREQEALEQLQASERIVRAAFGAHHPFRAVILTSLASTQASLGAHADAVATYTDAVETWAATAPDHPFHAIARLRLARYRLADGTYPAAEGLLRVALPILEASRGSDDVTTATARAMLGEALCKQGRRAEAEPLLRASLAPLDAAGAPADSMAVRARSCLGS